jgi:hypothetical protein
LRASRREPQGPLVAAAHALQTLASNDEEQTMKRGMRSVFGAAMAMGLVWVSFGAQGCKRAATPEEACKNVCECYAAAAEDPPPDACDEDAPDVSECTKVVGDQQELAKKDGCSREFDAYITCVARYDGTCEVQLNICEEENKTYNTCMANKGSEEGG